MGLEPLLVGIACWEGQAERVQAGEKGERKRLSRT